MINTSCTTPTINSSLSAEEFDAANIIVVSISLKAFYISVAVLGILGNTVVIVVIVNSKRLRNCTINILILNQSMLDGLSGVFIFLSCFFDKVSDVPLGWQQEIYCDLWVTKFPQWALFFSSTYNLVVLTYDRCLAICYPMWYKRIMYRKTRLVVVLVVVWCLGPMYYAPLNIITSTVKDGVCSAYTEWTSATHRALAGTTNLLLEYILPLVFICVAYLKIMYVLRSKTSINRTSSTNRNLRIQRARQNVLKTLAIVTVVLICCWTSDQVYFFMYNLGYPVSFDSWFYHFNVNLVFLNTCINPFVYSFQYKAFKQALVKLVCKHKRIQQHNNQVTSSKLPQGSVLSQSNSSMSSPNYKHQSLLNTHKPQRYKHTTI